MFVGEDYQKLDAKFRMTVPSQHRRYLEDGLMITRSIFEKCLLAFTLDEWEERAAKIEAIQNLGRHERQLRRQFFSRAERADMDKQGRILISQRLRNYAGISTMAVVAGNNTILELWSPEEWDKNAIDELDVNALDQVDPQLLNML